MLVDIPDDWMPCDAAINALPLPLRQLIHHLETNHDEAGMVRETMQLRDQVKALEIALAEATANEKGPPGLSRGGKGHGRDARRTGGR